MEPNCRSISFKTAQKMVRDGVATNESVGAVRAILGSQEDVIYWLWRVRNPILALCFIQYSPHWFNRSQILQIIGSIIWMRGRENAGLALSTLDATRETLAGAINSNHEMPKEFVLLFHTIATFGDDKIIEEVNALHIPGIPYLPSKLHKIFYRAPAP